MGKGLFISISNSSTVPITIDYDNIKYVHENGKQGSNFAKITGILQPGHSFDVQYIEASAHVYNPASFRMNLHGDFDPLSLDFKEKDGWSVIPNKVIGGQMQMQASATVVPGNQDRINVKIHRNVS